MNHREIVSELLLADWGIAFELVDTILQRCIKLPGLLELCRARLKQTVSRSDRRHESVQDVDEHHDRVQATLAVTTWWRNVRGRIVECHRLVRSMLRGAGALLLGDHDVLEHLDERDSALILDDLDGSSRRQSQHARMVDREHCLLEFLAILNRAYL